MYREKVRPGPPASGVELVLEAESLNFTDHPGPKGRQRLPSQILVEDREGSVRIGRQLTGDRQNGVEIFFLQQFQLGFQRTRRGSMSLLPKGIPVIDDGRQPVIVAPRV